MCGDVMVWIICGTLIFIQIVSCLDSHCQWTHTGEMACKDLKVDDIGKNIATQDEKNTVVLLNITESDIPEIDEDDFKHFNNLIELHITESQLDFIKNDTFRNNPKLFTLNLSNNYLEELTHSAYGSPNRIDTIDISKNMLENLSNFNITQFPKLKLLILDDNGLTFLPKGVIAKLKENNDFYLSVERNPWNCDHSEWKNDLNIKLIDAFCGGEKFVYVPKNKPIAREKRMDQFKLDIERLGANETSINSKNCLSCSFYFCIFWFVGGIWIGIILGNIFKIKKLLFSGPKKSYTEVGVQCEHPYIEQRRMADLQQGKYPSHNPTKHSSKVSLVKEQSTEHNLSPNGNVQQVSII